MMYFFDKKRRKLHMSTILTDKVSLPLDTYATGCNNNVAVIGSSGSGKTRSFVEPNVLQKNSSYIVSDAKGTILKDCGASLLSEKNGTEQYDIRVLNLQDMTRSMHYNPLKYVRSEQDVVFLANCIVLNTQSGDTRHTSDTFWQDQAVNLLTALIGYVAEVAPEKERNLNTVCRLFDLMNTKNDYCQNETDAIERLFENLKEDNPDSFAVRYYDEYAKVEGSGRAQASILASTAMCLAPYMLSPVKEVVRCDDMDIDSIDERPVALFIIYDDTDPTKNFLSNILYSQIFKILCHKADGRNDGMLSRHVRLFLDDFYNVCIPNFDRYIATIRSRNISACIMLQNESQLEAKYPKIYKSVIDNCNSYLFTGTFDVYAAEEMSKRFGILPRDVLRLPPGYFLVSSNKKIYKDKRYIPERHPNYVADFFDVEDIRGRGLPEYEDQIVIAQRDLIREAIKAETDDSYDAVDDIEADREIEQMTGKDIIDRYPVLRASPFNKPAEDKYCKELTYALYHAQYADENGRSKWFVPAFRPLISIHEPLTSIFDNAYLDALIGRGRYKLSNMTVDVVMRDPMTFSPILAIEITAKQYKFNNEQKEKDELKDNIFKHNNIPLVRIAESDVMSKVFAGRNIIERVIEEYANKNPQLKKLEYDEEQINADEAKGIYNTDSILTKDFDFADTSEAGTIPSRTSQ